ncbi:MAG TPA: hypothetical protein VMY76_17600 [Gemmatimonadales bacterium]|nr:hypothetical protein [Gemmatimonadales bacterium]
MSASRPSSGSRLRSLIVLLVAAGCGQGALEANGTPSRTVVLDAGRAFDLTLQTSGPGEYASPPLVSSGAVVFREVELVGPPVPAGPRQRFRFAAVAPGVAVLVFHHTGMMPTVEDTIEVH